MLVPTSSAVIAHSERSGLVPADLVSVYVPNSTVSVWLWLQILLVSEECIK